MCMNLFRNLIIARPRIFALQEMHGIHLSQTPLQAWIRNDNLTDEAVFPLEETGLEIRILSIRDDDLRKDFDRYVDDPS